MKFFLIVTFFCMVVNVSAQNVGIGTSAPQARLHVSDSSVVFSAPGLVLANPGNTPATGSGRRMMWYADKAAFRAGYAAGNSWDKINTGNYSFGVGYGSVASGDFSVAMGLNNIATGMSSIALGNNAQATTDHSIALGTISFASGNSSTSIGFQAFATGSYSSVLGYNSISKALGGTVVGMFNDVLDNPNPGTESPSDRIFQVGNGYYDANIDDEVRKNAITVLRNGNVGIGTVTPGYPLNFTNTTGDKISLYGNNGNHYGFGIQSALLQIHSDAPAANIAFGYGSSGSFTERARIINSGTDGMILSGRLHLKNGSSPVDVAQTGGVWLYKANNSGLLGFMGTENNQNIGFFGGPSGWGFTYDAINSRVGIGNNNPAYLLDVNGRIRLRHANAEEPGIWLNNNTNSSTPAFIGLQSNNKVGFYGSTAGWGLTMNTDNGSLAVNGNTGTDKQLLVSNGSNAAPQWTTAGNIFQSVSTAETVIAQLTGSTVFDLTASTMNLTITVPSRVILYLRTNTWKVCLAGACESKWRLTVLLNGVEIEDYGVDGVRYAAEFTSPGSDVTLGPQFIDLNPGIHTISFKGNNQFNEPYIKFSAAALIIPR